MVAQSAVGEGEPFPLKRGLETKLRCQLDACVMWKSDCIQCVAKAVHSFG